jgi:hypothetical protein
MTLKASSVIALVSCLVCNRCQALTTFTDQSTFLSATGPLNFESFESLSPAVVQSVTTSGFKLTCNPFAAGLRVQSAPTVTYPTDGIKNVQWQSFAGTYVTFQFNSPVNAFGLTIYGYGWCVARKLYCRHTRQIPIRRLLAWWQ